MVHAVRDVSFEVVAGEILGIVGESGSGKSTLARAILWLDPPTSGSVRYRGEDVSGLGRAQVRRFRSSAQIVLQDPGSALNPRLPVWRSVAEGMHLKRIPRRERQQRVAELLELVGLPPARMNEYPHQFSGGQKQRIAIARALAVEPELLVLDEPVSSLDVSIQAQIINLLLEIRRSMGLTYIFISHDLNLIGYLADRIGVMKDGELRELAPAAALLASPRDDYSQELFESSLAYHDRRRIPSTLFQEEE